MLALKTHTHDTMKVMAFARREEALRQKASLKEAEAAMREAARRGREEAKAEEKRAKEEERRKKLEQRQAERDAKDQERRRVKAEAAAAEEVCCPLSCPFLPFTRFFFVLFHPLFSFAILS